ncbi:hypothetical protein JA1_000999 [Spathaspora sp. JA1]|nr:hypothetical protein JA1_000999 [Spathaspora sp. JA1]
MGAFAKIKCFLACFILYYSVYLYNFKCPALATVDKSIIQTSPLYSEQVALCELLHTGVSKVQPYVQPLTENVHALLDQHVHSHPKFIEYKIEDKLTCAKGKLNTHVYPWFNKLFRETEIVEVHVYNYACKIYKESTELVKYLMNK